MCFLSCDQLCWTCELSSSIPLKKITVQNHICFAAVQSVNNVLSQNGKPGVMPYSKQMKVILSLNENIGRLNNHVSHSKLHLSRNRTQSCLIFSFPLVMPQSKTFLAKLLPFLVSQASNLGNIFKHTMFLSLGKTDLVLSESFSSTLDNFLSE